MNQKDMNVENVKKIAVPVLNGLCVPLNLKLISDQCTYEKIITKETKTVELIRNNI